MHEQEALIQPPPTSTDTAEFLLSQGPASVLDEIREVDFPVVRRGYDRDAVEHFIARVSQMVEDMVATRSPQLAVNRALENLGEETAGILRQAQDTARQITERSSAGARERLERAEREATRLQAEAEAAVRRLEADSARVRRERHRLIEDTRRLADGLLKVADDADERFPAEPEQATNNLPDAGSTDAPSSDAPEPGTSLPESPAERAIAEARSRPAPAAWARAEVKPAADKPQDGGLVDLGVSVPEFTGNVVTRRSA
jgi:DivIVA domain-containing protein